MMLCGPVTVISRSRASAASAAADFATAEGRALTDAASSRADPCRGSGLGPDAGLGLASCGPASAILGLPGGLGNRLKAIADASALCGKRKLQLCAHRPRATSRQAFERYRRLASHRRHETSGNARVAQVLRGE